MPFPSIAHLTVVALKLDTLSVMKLRCPYCTNEFEPQKRCVCPRCGKTMRIPTGLRTGIRPRKKRIHPDRTVMPTRSAPRARSARILIVCIVVLFVMGMLLAQKSSHPKPQLTPRDKTALACRNLLHMGIALTNFNGTCGRYPSTEEGLSALVRNPGVDVWTGPYLMTPRQNPWNDPWNRPYRYSYSNNTAALSTAGPDGQHGTDDDLVCPYFRETTEDRVNAAIERWTEKRTTSTTAVHHLPQ